MTYEFRNNFRIVSFRNRTAREVFGNNNHRVLHRRDVSSEPLLLQINNMEMEKKAHTRLQATLMIRYIVGQICEKIVHFMIKA